MPKKLPLKLGKSYNKINHERRKSSHSIECLDSCMLSHNLKENGKLSDHQLRSLEFRKSITITIKHNKINACEKYGIKLKGICFWQIVR